MEEEEIIQQEPPKLSPSDFAKQVKTKYPQYEGVEDSILVEKLISKYPVYKDKIDFSVKKKDIAGSEPISPLQSLDSPVPTENISSDTSEPVEPKSKLQEGLDFAKNFTKMRFEQGKDALMHLASGTSETLAGLSGIPNFINKIKFNATLGTARLLGIDGVDNFEKTVNDLPQDEREKLINSLDSMNNPISGALATVSAKEQEVLTNISEEINAKTKQYEGNITDDIANGNVEQAAIRAVNGMAASAPSLVLAAAPGGLLAIGAGTASQKQEQLEREGEDLSTNTVMNAIVNGTAEGVFEKATAGLLRPLKGVLKGNKELAEQFADNFTVNLFKSMGIEATSEGLTSISQQLSDAFFMREEDEEFKLPENFWKNVADASLIGGLMGGGIATTTIAAKRMMPPEKLKDVELAEKRVSEIDNELQSDMPDNLKKELRAVKTELEGKIEAETQSEFERFKNLPKEERLKLGDLESQLNTLKQEYDAIESNPNLSDESKKALLARKSEEGRKLLESKQSIINAESKEETDQTTEQEVEGTTLEEQTEEEVDNEKAPEQNTPTDGNVQPTTGEDIQQGQDNNVQPTVEPTTGTREVKRVNPEGVKGEFDVEIDESGNVSKVTSLEGREVPKFVERTLKDGSKKLVRNGNYSKIVAGATDTKTENQINTEERAKVNEAINSFEPSNEYEAALNYLAKGGKVKLSDAISQGQDANSGKWAAGFNNEKDLPSIERASELAIQDLERNDLDQQTVRDELETLVRSNGSISDINQKVMDIVSENTQRQAEEELRVFKNSLSSEELATLDASLAEDEYLSELTYDEKVQYYREQFPQPTEDVGEPNGATTSVQGIQGEIPTNESIRLFEKYLTKGRNPTEGERRTIQSANIARGNGQTNQSNLGDTRQEKTFQEKRLKDYAEKEGFWLSEDDIIKNQLDTFPSGKEASVYISEDKNTEPNNNQYQGPEETQAQGITSGKGNRDAALSEGGPVKKLNPFQAKFKRFWNNTFKTNQGAPKEVAESVRSLGRELSALTDAIEYEASQIKQISRNIRRKAPSKFNERMKLLNDYMSGEKGIDVSFLSKEDLETMDALRGRIDLASSKLQDKLNEALDSQKEKLEGMPEGSIGTNSVSESIERLEALIATIESNKGKYLYRSYQAFTDKGYLKNLTSSRPNREGRERIQKAVDYIMGESQDLFGSQITEEQARTQVFEYLEKFKGNDDFISAISNGRADAPFLKKRKEVPEPIRELLGESKDPIYNYVTTVFKISKYLANMEYQNKLVNAINEAGLGSYEAQAGYSKLTSDGEGWNATKGLYVPNELKESIEDLQPLKTIEDGFYKGWVMFAAFTKVGKTVLSPTTTARNFLSGVFLGFNAGFNFAGNPSKTLEALRQAYGTEKSKAERTKERQKLFKLGVLGDGAISQEVMETMNDFTKELDRMVRKNALQHTMAFTQKVYAIGDSFYKVAGYYQYKSRYMKSGMTESEAETKAAERINDTFPTYSMIPKNIQKLRRVPLVGTFVSFPYEVVRTTANGFKYIQEDIKAGRTSMAMKQIAGMLVANATLPALSAYTASMIGFDDEDDDNVRNMLPEWQKNSSLLYVGKEDGKPRFIDGTALFPGETILKPIRTLLEERSGRDIGDKMKEALDEAITPYLGLDVSFKTASELVFNRDAYDKEIYEGENLTEGIFNDPEKIANYYMKQAGPGVYNNLTEFLRSNEVSPDKIGDKYTSYGREYTNRDALMALIGFRFSTLNYASGMTSIGYDTKKKYDNTRQEVIKGLKTTRKLSEDEVMKMVKKYDKANKEVSDDIFLSIKGARKLGLNDYDIRNALKQSGFSAKDISALIDGVVPPLKEMSKTSVRNQTAKIELNVTDEAKEQELLNNLYDNTDLFNSLIYEIEE